LSVLLARYHSDDQIERNVIGRACSTYEEARNIYRVLVGKTEGRRPLGKPRHRWEDNIKMGLQMWGVDLIELAQDRGRWRDFVN
jgi:hypothetical protein